MPREFASVNVDLWADPDFRDLPAAVQHLYLMLWTSPGLSHCGVHDWRPARLTGLCAGLTAAEVKAAADCLAARYFLVVDESTEEVLVRSWGRFDGLMKQPKMAISYINAYAAVASSTLRRVLVHETEKIRSKTPDLSCWLDDRVQAVLAHPSVSAKDLPIPEDPFAHGLTPASTPGFNPGLGQGLGVCLTESLPNVSPMVSHPHTPAPTPTPLTKAPENGATVETSSKVGGETKPAKKKPSTTLPDDWHPTSAHRTIAAGRGLDLETEVKKFRSHAEATDRRQVVWNASFSQWLLSARPPLRPVSTAGNDWMHNR